MDRGYHLAEAARYERLARECAPDTGALAAMPHGYYVDMAVEHRRAADIAPAHADVAPLAIAAGALMPPSV